MSDRVLFTIAPYVAALIFVAVTFTRRPLGGGSVAAEAEPVESASSVSLATRSVWLKLRDRLRRRMFRFALLLVLIAHALMWLAPALLLAWSQSVTRVIAGEIALFAIGLIAAAGLLRALVDALRARRDTPLADVILLGVLAVAIGSGLILAARYRWASTWSAVTLTPYLRSLLMFAPDTTQLALPYVIKLHVFSGIALLAVLPFTSVMRPVTVVVERLRDLAITPIVAVVSRQATRAAGWASESGRALVWPEPEDED
jgi:nitrate reductase gamma subunit